MTRNDDLYQMLGIPLDATPAQIKEAYLYKVNILHPDRLGAMPERIRQTAEEELKKVNAAYEVLSNPTRRQQYDRSRSGGTITSSTPPPSPRSPGKPPKPEAHPRTISFNRALAYVPEKGSFFVRNVGGPYKKVLTSAPAEWLKIVKTVPLQDGMRLPMRVDIEAVGIQWGKTYSSEIIVRLDDEESKVKVKLRTQKKPR